MITPCVIVVNTLRSNPRFQEYLTTLSIRLVPGGNNGILRQCVAMTVAGGLAGPEAADMRCCSSLMRAAWALAHLFAGDNLARHGKAHLRHPAYTEASHPMRSLEFRIHRLDVGTDPVPFPPFRRLLECIHLIPQAKLRRHLQAEVPGGVTC